MYIHERQSRYILRAIFRVPSVLPESKPCAVLRIFTPPLQSPIFLSYAYLLVSFVL